MDINIVSFKFSDQELMELKLKEDEKLTRYLKCYNEATERTQRFIYDIDIEIAKRKLQKETREAKDKETRYIHYCNYMD
jgi:hypothetical protein